MPYAPPSFKRYECARADAQREYEARRREQKPWRALYKTAAWQKLRSRRLAENPLCQAHLLRGETVVADTVNHVRPHRGDADLFFNYGNTESLCKRCHDSDVQKNERGVRAGE